jgi:propanediol dehydratase small subunit
MMSAPPPPPTYPLIDDPNAHLCTASGRPLAEVTFEAAVGGALTPDDLRIHADTLRAQAAVAQAAGFPQLALNLRRAAELTAVPNDELLKMYELLRPGRATFETLLALAERLERLYAAPETARFVREAAATYRTRNLLFREG